MERIYLVFFFVLNTPASTETRGQCTRNKRALTASSSLLYIAGLKNKNLGNNILLLYFYAKVLTLYIF